MIDFFRDALREHLLLTVFLVGLLPAGAFSVISMAFPFGREIVYDTHTVFATCGSSGAIAGRHCTARVELIIGNTGNSEESVRIVWPRYEGPWGRDHNVLDISADRPRSGDPVIDCTVAEGRQECAIDRFAAGALVVMHLDCYRCSKREVEWLDDSPLEVQSAAHVSYGDPRVTLLFRRLTALVRLFI